MPVMNADGPAPQVLLADKGYDADFIHIVSIRLWPRQFFNAS